MHEEPVTQTTLPAQWHDEQYQLIDFGGGRKLERFGAHVLDRPAPPALGIERTPGVDWSIADCFLESNERARLPALDPWPVRFGPLVFDLKLTPFGHVGLFPEQFHNWRWLFEQVQTVEHDESPPIALNLFGYTGGTTLALALAGARVVHVDASAPAVAWARHNAQVSGLEACPVRWIVEDARKFTERELRRGNRYDVIVLDPPSYGHGPKGKPWVISEHLPDLLRNCVDLLQPHGNPLLLMTAHSDSPTPTDVRSLLLHASRHPRVLTDGRLLLNDHRARPLDAGYYLRARY